MAEKKARQRHNPADSVENRKRSYLEDYWGKTARFRLHAEGIPSGNSRGDPIITAKCTGYSCAGELVRRSYMPKWWSSQTSNSRRRQIRSGTNLEGNTRPDYSQVLGSYSTKPIYIFGGLGLASAIGSILAGLAVLYQKIFSELL